MKSLLRLVLLLPSILALPQYSPYRDPYHPDYYARGYAYDRAYRHRQDSYHNDGYQPAYDYDYDRYAAYYGYQRNDPRYDPRSDPRYDPYAYPPRQQDPYHYAQAYNNNRYDRYPPGHYPGDHDRYRYPDRLRGKESLGREEEAGLLDFDSHEAMQDARKAAQSTRAVADLVDSMHSNRDAGALMNLLGDSRSDVGKALGDLSSIIRSTANLMEKGTGTLVQIKDSLAD